MNRKFAILRRLRRRAIAPSAYGWMALAICLAQAPAIALADGGTLQRSQRCGDFQVSVFTSPAAPRVGPIDVSVLVQDAKTGQIRDDVPVSAELECVDGDAISLEQSATSATATNRLFQAAQFDVPAAGTWRVTVSLPLASAGEPIEFDLAIAPPPPPWMQLAPWVGWPFVLIALFLVHQLLAARRRRA